MKNKRLIGTLIFLVILTVGSIVYDQFGSSSSSSSKQVKVGILQYVTHDALDEIEQGIEDGLKDAGYSGDKIKLTVLNAEADQSKIQTMSKQLVDAGNDVVIGIATPAAQGLASATSEIPVVMGAISDPVGAKLVSNLEKPNKNVTGTSNQVPIKQEVELIRDITPDAKTIGVLYASSEDNSVSQVADFKKYAEAEGLTVVEYAVPSTNEITTTMSVMTTKVDAIWVPQDNTIASAFTTVISAANEAKIPVYSSVDTMVEQGSIASVAQSQYQLGIETAKIAVEILEGKKVSEIPVKVIDTGTPTVNLKAAKELGITIPDSVLETATVAVKADE
ncbi:tryptophan ABC transporter substrate-binding protein [Streptococcus loxodontisalivarius]|uniref:ABC transport system substrate-binding protein n=1 Tax=Streptococcus loxodontisalivarius TaxID=1349415 RepID=A0ABS2PNW6_9STRE|nr:tryptophan ABC transporter substrate-binding protein [Streptococcus loxodontisalivarius]MBM7641717.1 putative ABC transport system substrate-binding protein [Streptococcus loxodontisalivarius]